MKLLMVGMLCTIFCASFGFSQADIYETRIMLPEVCMAPFYHGVASGDPTSSNVIIWTRVTPNNESMNPIHVKWRVATDTSMTNVVAHGTYTTSSDRDFTVKVDVGGLSPDRWYYYEFSAYGKRSIIGRTRTTPSYNHPKDSLRFAVVSCANLEGGFFHVYKEIAERNDLDAVVCLGDYFYEYAANGYLSGPSSYRAHVPLNEVITLTDYRLRHAVYHLDENLRRAHQLYPWFVIWDDHESANDAWLNGAQNHNVGEGTWAMRKNASRKAYFEWLPIRENHASGELDIYRTANYGTLLDIVLLDTRLTGREQQINFSNSQYLDSNRTVLGAVQKNWFFNRLMNSTAQYKLIAQQIMFSPLQAFGFPLNPDQWDGYPAERRQILNKIVTDSIENVVILAGDVHASFAIEVPRDSVAVAVEIITPSVTSPATSFYNSGGPSSVIASNPHIKWCSLTNRGYVVVDVNSDRMQADWYLINSVFNQESVASLSNSLYKFSGSNELHQAMGPAMARAELFAVIPDYCPVVEDDIEPIVDDLSIDAVMNDLVIMGIHPNPTRDLLTVQFSLLHQSNLQLEITDDTGRTLSNYEFKSVEGTWIHQIDLQHLQSGKYVLRIKPSNSNPVVRSFIKL